MGSGPKKIGPGGYCRREAHNFLRDWRISSQAVCTGGGGQGSRRLGALLLGSEAGRSRLPQATPPRWRLHILSSPAKERDFWELETCQRLASPQSTFLRKKERAKGLGRTRRGT